MLVLFQFSFYTVYKNHFDVIRFSFTQKQQQQQQRNAESQNDKA